MPGRERLNQFAGAIRLADVQIATPPAEWRAALLEASVGFTSRALLTATATAAAAAAAATPTARLAAAAATAATAAGVPSCGKLKAAPCGVERREALTNTGVKGASLRRPQSRLLKGGRQTPLQCEALSRREKREAPKHHNV